MGLLRLCYICIRFGQIWIGLDRLDRIGQGWIGLDRFGQVWIGLDRFGHTLLGLHTLCLAYSYSCTFIMLSSLCTHVPHFVVTRAHTLLGPVHQYTKYYQSLHFYWILHYFKIHSHCTCQVYLHVQVHHQNLSPQKPSWLKHQLCTINCEFPDHDK